MDERVLMAVFGLVTEARNWVPEERGILWFGNF